MVQVFTLVAAVLTCVVGVSGHLCLLNPEQRGTIQGLNTAGSDDCKLVEGPCGGRGLGSYIVFQGGKNYSVIFQKNQDQYLKANPGYFSISFSPYPANSFKEAVRVPDMGEPSLHLYRVDVPLPAGDNKLHIMQITYVTNNSKAPPVFYQCADMLLY